MNRFTDQIRRAMATSGLSLSEIARRSNIDRGQLSRFYHGKCGIGTERMQALMDVLDLAVMPRSEASDGRQQKTRQA